MNTLSVSQTGDRRQLGAKTSFESVLTNWQLGQMNKLNQNLQQNALILTQESAYGSGLEGAAVLLPGFAIKW